MDGDGGYTKIEIEDGAEEFMAHHYFMTNASLSGRGKALEESSSVTPLIGYDNDE